MSPNPQNAANTLFATRMKGAGLPEAAIRAFDLHLSRYLSGESGMLSRRQLAPVGEIAHARELEPDAAPDSDLLRRTVVIKLNGGLGTGMGLEQAKSLIDVRTDASFIELIVRQVLSLRRQLGSPVPLLLMNSFRTAADASDVLVAHPGLPVGELPLGFLQHQVPRVLAANGTPAVWPTDPELEWCPPGHGDLYTALATTKILDRLLSEGFQYAFASNADNLGAVLDPGLLSFMAGNGADFMMEVADRTPADRKGGHLCRLLDGRLALRESAQCPPDEVEEFQDTARYRYFNTNNIWFSLPALARLLESHRGVLPMDTIVNPKTIDPRDPTSPEVIQLETAMGAAISLFDNAAAVRVPRTRFSPVKSTSDLLAVRSDAYELTDDGRVVLAGELTAPPTVRLDPRFFKNLSDFDQRFPAGPPSLVGCTSLSVAGNVTFGEGIVIEGDVAIRGGDEPSRIPDGTVLRGEHRA